MTAKPRKTTAAPAAKETPPAPVADTKPADPVEQQAPVGTEGADLPQAQDPGTETGEQAGSDAEAVMDAAVPTAPSAVPSQIFNLKTARNLPVVPDSVPFAATVAVQPNAIASFKDEDRSTRLVVAIGEQFFKSEPVEVAA